MTKLIDEDTGIDTWNRDVPELVSYRAAAALLQINYQDLYKFTSLGLAQKTVEKRKVYWRQDIEAFLKSADRSTLQLLYELRAAQRARLEKQRKVRRRGPRMASKEILVPSLTPSQPFPWKQQDRIKVRKGS